MSVNELNILQWSKTVLVELETLRTLTSSLERCPSGHLTVQSPVQRSLVW